MQRGGPKQGAIAAEDARGTVEAEGAGVASEGDRSVGEGIAFYDQAADAHAE